MDFGISVALLTPFHEDESIDVPFYTDHAKEMLDRGADGITLFGTTGEGASIGLDERKTCIEQMIAADVQVEQMTVGICANSVSDAVEQVKQACRLGVTRFLLLPPFYFKGVSDDALYQWHAKLFEVAPAEATFILYHIPQVTQIAISQQLSARLAANFQERIIGLKDSEGNWDSTKARLIDGSTPILVGDERILHKAAALGAVGSICGMANLYPERIKQLFNTHTEDRDLCADVDLIVSYPVIASIKQAKVAMTGNKKWGYLRRPLTPLNETEARVIHKRFAHLKENA